MLDFRSLVPFYAFLLLSFQFSPLSIPPLMSILQVIYNVGNTPSTHAVLLSFWQQVGFLSGQFILPPKPQRLKQPPFGQCPPTFR